MPARLPAATRDRLLLAAAVAYLVAVALIQLLGIGLTPPDVGSSPDELVDGAVWRLLTSALIVDGDLPGGQLVILIAASGLVLARCGAVVWWLAALAGHVGSALIAYAGIGIAILLGVGSAEQVADDWDYGVSCVLSAQLGVLFAYAVGRVRTGRGGRGDVALLTAAAAFLVFAIATLDWYGVEHPLAFALGAAVLVLHDRVARPAR